MKKIVFLILLIVALSAVSMLSINLANRNLQKSIDQKIAVLQKQVSGLGQQIAGIASDNQNIIIPPTEIIQREIIREKSQEELLTSAVAKVAPAVVSVAVSKEVPQMEIVYQNPFGDDPFFKDFGFRIPVYRYKGTVKQQVGAGTGFLFRPDGYILSNRHVVEDSSAEYTVLLADGRQQQAQVVYKDANWDVAILKIPGSSYPYAEIGNSDLLKLGQTVAAIGNAFGQYNNSVSVGIISGLNREINASGVQLKNVIQTDAAINPGNSGGPLLDLNGRVVGMNVATIIGSQSIGFSLPINTVKSIVKNTVGI